MGFSQSEMDLSSSISHAVKEYTISGFEGWNLGYFSDDTLYVYRAHQPIIDGIRVGIILILIKKYI
jgi:hypothetical protein